MSAINSFPCPQCGGRMEVKDSRPTNYHNRGSIRRRRKCRKCHWALTTYEIMDNAVQKADARLGHVMLGIRRAHEAMGALIESFDDQSDADNPAHGNDAADQNSSRRPA